MNLQSCLSPSQHLLPTLSVVVMAWNEEENVGELLARLGPYLDGKADSIRGWEVIVVDDGSTDATAAVVAEWACREPRIQLAKHGRNLGMGAAIRTGYGAARCDYVTQLPADLQVPPETFDLFLPHIPQFDLVLSVYEDRGDSALRRLLAGGYRAVARLLLGQRADYTGTMMFRRSLLEGLELTSDSFVANLEFPLKALNRGAASTIVTFVPSPRLHGESKVANTRRILLVLGELVKLRLRGL
jgi:glycosyltransferase involved in cell wall biosynthesis